jgi:beta-RFAP synthase
MHRLPMDIEDDAILLGRGSRSGIGLGVFKGGGLVVDGGRGESTKVPPVISHVAFPQNWRVLVVLDPRRQGIYGAQELEAFSRLPPLPAVDVGHVCRLVLMRALPAVAESNIAAFGSAIKEIQARLGDYFAPAQGGRRFTSPDVESVLQRLETHGAFGIGQSSWGPTGFAFAETETRANQLAAMARQHRNARGLDIRICAGLNRGAEIDTMLHAEAED